MINYLQIILFFIFFLSFKSVLCSPRCYVNIKSNGPVVLGADITFNAEIFNEDGTVPKGPFRFYWLDDAIPQHNDMFELKSSISNWTLKYPSSIYPPGPYEVEVRVEYYTWFNWWPLTSRREHFNLTMLLNGNMQVRQNSTLVSKEYISTALPSIFEIELKQSDYDYLTQNATSILTYWFIDCVYFGSTTNFTFEYFFKNATETHSVEALVVASYEPIPPPTTTTTTTTTTTMKTTTTTVTTSTTTTTTTPKPKPTSASERIISTPSEISVSSTKPSDKPAIVKRDTSQSNGSTSQATESLNNSVQEPMLVKKGFENKNLSMYVNGSLQFPFICLNQSIVPIDVNKTYGYFHRKIIVEDPVSNLTISGNNWLQHKDMLMLQAKCKGTPPYEYCVHYESGTYNVTGNETCETSILAPSCDFFVTHYFSNADIHTVVIIVINNVNKIVSPVTVRFYQVVTKAQLSVIVVPVSFCIIAAILIVFGVAYYIQHRSRFTVEVADFDFGQQYADLEYKTFGERLKESFNNALNWGGTRDSESPGPAWPNTDNNKYGTMT